MTPIVNGLETEFAGQVAVHQLDAAEPENERLMLRYGMRGHPTFVVLDDAGGVTARFSGPQPVETLREAMAAVDTAVAD